MSPERPGRSLYVRLFETERGAIGNWVDAATGEHGDLVDLIRLNQRHGRLGRYHRRGRTLPQLATVGITTMQHSRSLRQTGTSRIVDCRQTPVRRIEAARRLSGRNLSAITRHHADYPTCQPCGSIRAATTAPMMMMSQTRPEHSRH